MEIRNGYETALDDIKYAFSYLTMFGFIFAGKTGLGHKAGIGYLGRHFNISLTFEFIEENFDFSIIDVSNSSIYQPLWRIIKYFNPDVNLFKFSPNGNKYQSALTCIAEEFRTVLPKVLHDRDVLNKIQ